MFVHVRARVYAAVKVDYPAVLWQTNGPELYAEHSSASYAGCWNGYSDISDFDWLQQSDGP